jgi:hypothetical protein
MEALIDQFLFWVIEGCERNSDRFCEEADGLTCIHAQASFNCLQVSKEFLRVGARYLWSNYATFPDLLRLVGVNDSGRDNGGCVSQFKDQNTKGVHYP